MPRQLEEHPGWEGLNPELQSRLYAMVQQSGGRLWLVSGYRSEERQRQLWEQALAKYGDPEIADNWVARPGESNHNHGNAVDIGGTAEGMEWMAANLHRFGLWRPMDHEPWHVEVLDTALDPNPKAYTPAPMGGREPLDKTDPGFQLTQLLAVLDKGQRDFTHPLSGLGQNPNDYGTESSFGADTIAPPQPLKDFGFREEPSQMEDEINAVMDDE